MKIILYIGGEKYKEYKAITINQSMQQLTGTFDVDVFDSNYAVQPGMECELTIDGATVITGNVTDCSDSYSANEESFNIRGRDKTADIVDSYRIADPMAWGKTSIASIIEALCKPFGVELVQEVEASEILPTYRYSLGTQIYAEIEKLCKKAGVIPVSYGDGKITITRAGKRGVSAVLMNPKSGVIISERTRSEAERFSIYRIIGQGGQSDTMTQDEYIACKADQTDSGVARYRPYCMTIAGATNNKQCLDRAKWELATRTARSERINLQLSGWKDSDGVLWRINTTTYYRDRKRGIERDMLIESVTFSLSLSGGFTTDLSLVAPEAYSIEPQEPEEAVAAEAGFGSALTTPPGGTK